MALLFITHDLNLVRASRRVGVMERGRAGRDRADRARCSRTRSTRTRGGCSRAGRVRVVQPIAADAPLLVAGARCRRRRSAFRAAGSRRRRIDAVRRRDACSCAAARRSASSANRARARRRSAWRCSRCSRSRRGEIDVGGVRVDNADRARLRAHAPAHAGGVPGPVRVAQPAHDGRPDRRRGPRRCTGPSSARAERDALVLQMLDEVGLERAPWRRRRARALSARVLGRPAPAHRDRARGRAATRGAGARRADFRARRLGAAAGAGAARPSCSAATA